MQITYIAFNRNYINDNFDCSIGTLFSSGGTASFHLTAEETAGLVAEIEKIAERHRVRMANEMLTSTYTPAIEHEPRVDVITAAMANNSDDDDLPF